MPATRMLTWIAKALPSYELVKSTPRGEYLRVSAPVSPSEGDVPLTVLAPAPCSQQEPTRGRVAVAGERARERALGALLLLSLVQDRPRRPALHLIQAARYIHEPPTLVPSSISAEAEI
jgi:hypothetical protein